jgi:transitional endoplasmic reticulum ATPase
MEQTVTGNPDWFEAVTSDYRAGVAHTFILHGTTADYVEDPGVDQTVTDYLSGRLSGSFTVVAFSPDQGITFPGTESDLDTVRKASQEARKRFGRVTGTGGAELSEIEKLAMQAGGLNLGQDQELPRDPSRAIPMLIQFLTEADGGEAVFEDRRVADADGQPTEETTRVMVGTNPEDPGDGTGMRALVIMERLDLVVPPADKGTMDPAQRALLSALGRIGTAGTVQARGGLLVMLAPSLAAVHDDLKATSAGIRSIEITPPTYEQRLSYLERIAIERELTFTTITLGEVASECAGLGRRHMEDIALRALQATGGEVTRALVNARRAELLDTEYSGILEVVESNVTMGMVGGHELAVEYITDEVVALFLSDDPEVRALVPLGMLLAGPSGTGKTWLARGTANALKRRMVRLRAENIKGKYMGESEQKLAKAFAGIEAMAPCVLFLDEVDQSVRRGGGGETGGSSVDDNMFGRLLEWLADESHRWRIFTVAATNRPDTLDAAFLRPGRFDVKIPLLVPQSAGERQDILDRLLSRYGATASASVFDAMDDLGESTDGWTPAELENLVLLALRLVKIKGLELGAALKQARGRLKSATRDVERMTLLALSICDDLAVVPERWQAFVSEPVPAEETAPVAARAPGPRRGRNLDI